MEVLGTLSDDIVSVSTSSVAPTSFVSLCSKGALTLWDTRLKNKAYATIQSEHRGGEASEVLFVADRYSAVAMGGEQLALFDVRKLSSGVKHYNHDCELVQFLAGSQPPGLVTTLVVDECGAVIPMDLLSLRRVPHVPDTIFGEGHVVDGPEERFGSLSNYCCALERMEDADGAPCLVSVGMDGDGVLFRSPMDAFPFHISSELAGGGGGYIVNPPLPTCCRALRHRLAVGRADGSYTIAEVLPSDGVGSEDGSLEEELSAAAHPTSGLCGVEWVGSVGSECLLTVPLCGDITAWGVLDFLSIPEDEFDEEELPAVRSAYSVREELLSKNSVINCMAKAGESTVIIGDTLGNIVWCDIQII